MISIWDAFEKPNSTHFRSTEVANDDGSVTVTCEYSEQAEGSDAADCAYTRTMNYAGDPTAVAMAPYFQAGRVQAVSAWSPHTIDSLLKENEELRERLATKAANFDDAILTVIGLQKEVAELARLLAAAPEPVSPLPAKRAAQMNIKPALPGLNLEQTDEKYRGLGYCDHA